MARTLALAMMLAVASGCGAAPSSRTYSEQELEQRCVRAGGWWHPDTLMGGYCEFRSAGSL